MFNYFPIEGFIHKFSNDFALHVAEVKVVVQYPRSLNLCIFSNFEDAFARMQVGAFHGFVDCFRFVQNMCTGSYDQVFRSLAPAHTVDKPPDRCATVIAEALANIRLAENVVEVEKLLDIIIPYTPSFVDFM